MRKGQADTARWLPWSWSAQHSLLPSFRSASNSLWLGTNPGSPPAAALLWRCVQGGDKGEETTWKQNWLHERPMSCNSKMYLYSILNRKQLKKCCLAFIGTAAATYCTHKTNLDFDPSFLERPCGIECGSVRGGALSCVHRWCATQHTSLLSVVLWMSNLEALTPTRYPLSPLYTPYSTWPCSLKRPRPTWWTVPSAWGFCAPNEPNNNVTSNVKARVIRAYVCVLRGVVPAIKEAECSCHRLPSNSQCNQMH